MVLVIPWGSRSPCVFLLLIAEGVVQHVGVRGLNLLLGLGVVDNLDAPIELHAVVQILLVKHLSLLLRCSSLLLSLIPARLNSGMISLSFGGFVGADRRRFFVVLILSREVDRSLISRISCRMDTEGHSRLVESFNHDLLFDLELG